MKPTAAPITSLASSLEPLREWFTTAADHARVLAIMSAT